MFSNIVLKVRSRSQTRPHCRRHRSCLIVTSFIHCLIPWIILPWVANLTILQVFLPAVVLVATTFPFVHAIDNFLLTLDPISPEIKTGNGDDHTDLLFKFGYQDFDSTKSLVPNLMAVVNGGCFAPATPVTGVAVVPIGTPASGDSTLPVTVRITHSSIDPSQFYSKSSDGSEGYVDFCIKLDYHYDGEVYGTYITKVRMTSDLKADCKYCPITLEDTPVDPRSIEKYIESSLTCSLCSGSNKGPFKVGDQVDICVAYNYPGSNICVQNITSADLFQSIFDGPTTPTCCGKNCPKNNDVSWLKTCSCFDSTSETHLNLADTHVVGVYKDGCKVQLSFIVSQDWFKPPHAGNPLGIHINGLLGFGANNDRKLRRLGAPYDVSRTLEEEPIAAAVSIDQPFSLIDCKAVNARLAALRAKKINLNKKIAAAKNRPALKAQLTKQLNAVLAQLKAQRNDQALCTK